MEYLVLNPIGETATYTCNGTRIGCDKCKENRLPTETN